MHELGLAVKLEQWLADECLSSHHTFPPTWIWEVLRKKIQYSLRYRYFCLQNTCAQYYQWFHGNLFPIANFRGALASCQRSGSRFTVPIYRPPDLLFPRAALPNLFAFPKMIVLFVQNYLSTTLDITILWINSAIFPFPILHSSSENYYR